MHDPLKIHRFLSLAEEDRLQVLWGVQTCCGLALRPATLGVLAYAMDHGTRRLSPAQTLHLIFNAWCPCVTVECTRCGELLPPDEMVPASENDGHCLHCQHAWERIQAE